MIILNLSILSFYISFGRLSIFMQFQMTSLNKGEYFDN